MSQVGKEATQQNMIPLTNTIFHTRAVAWPCTFNVGIRAYCEDSRFTIQVQHSTPNRVTWLITALICPSM